MDGLIHSFNLSKRPRSFDRGFLMFFAILFYAFADSGEGFWIANSDFCEDLAVKLDAFVLHAVDQLAVADTVFAGSVVDASDPECA